MRFVTLGSGIFWKWGEVPGVRARLDDADDRTLAGRAGDGDVYAFEVLIRRYGPLMRAYASRILRSNSEADDAVQEAFIAAWQQLPTLEDSSVVRSWLMRIVSRKSIDFIRSRRVHASLDDFEPEAPPSQSPAQVAEAHSQEEALSRSLWALPEKQRNCWVLRELAQYSYGEIASQLEIPESTVRGLLARARKNLMREMEVWR